MAYRNASVGKRGRLATAAFEHHLEENLFALQDELRTRAYQPGKYHSFYIHEPKRRLISAAPFRDRVVHHALCNLIEPVFERSFITDSYANRIGKGTHRALNRCQEFARRYKYVLQCDLEQFFPSIDLDILRRILYRELRDEQTRWLIDSIIESGAGVHKEAYTMRWFPSDDLFAVNRTRGLPIGNLTSQFWANCYLNAFDHFAKRTLRCPGYIRYVDDLLFFGDDKQDMWRWHTAIVDRLAQLRLTLHDHVQPRPVSEGVPFLGFIVFPQQRRLKPRKGFYFQRNFKRLLGMYSKSQCTLGDLNAAVQGWVNHVRYGNTIGLREAIFTEHSIPPSGITALRNRLLS